MKDTEDECMAQVQKDMAELLSRDDNVFIKNSVSIVYIWE